MPPALKVVIVMVMLALVIIVALPIMSPYFINQGVIRTAEGIPKKIVIKKDKTILYDSPSLNSSVGLASQWDIFYVYDVSDRYYGISRIFEEHTPKNMLYVSKQDVFEWNTYLCLNYKNSPDQANRPPVKIYKTLEQAKLGEGEAVFQEKAVHDTSFSPTDAQPVLQKYDDSVYRIATLYDNTRNDGTYVFLGNYDFGYIKYSDLAYEFRRYVNKQQLQEQLLLITGVTSLAKPNVNPTELDLIYGSLSSLLADFGGKTLSGMKDILAIFAGQDVPNEVQHGIFSQESMRGGQTEALQKQLLDMTRTMNDYLINPDNWNEAGYSYVPAEWLQTTK